MANPTNQIIYGNYSRLIFTFKHDNVNNNKIINVLKKNAVYTYARECLCFIIFSETKHNINTNI